MPTIRLVHFTEEEMVVPERREHFDFFKLGDRHIDVFAAPESMFRSMDIERRVFEGIKMYDPRSGEQVYYFDIEEAKKAMPIIGGIISSRCEKAERRAYEAERALRETGEELRKTREELGWLRRRWYNRLAQFLTTIAA
jgi:hypothetical protein